MKHVKLFEEYKRFSLINENKFDYDKVIDLVNNAENWDMQETETDDCTRFDKGEGDNAYSVWIYKDGTADGSSLANDEVKKILKDNGAKINLS
jgi:hypothetical protein